jgi:hypothetical protein
MGRRLLAATLVLTCAAQASEPTPEASVKAAYIYKLAPFVAWPSSAFASSSSPFVVCVLGDEDPLDSALEQTAGAQHVGAHPAVVRRLSHVDAGSGCHMLYLGASHEQSSTDAIRNVRGEPVLTVSDLGSAPSGAIVQFVVKDNRVRLDIDKTAAATNHVAISSKLMSLAISSRAGT